MIKTNLTLLAVLLVSAVALVTSQHRARMLYAELERERQTAKQIEIEWDLLNIEQSTWSMHSRIEKVAASRLHMMAPSQERVQMLDPNAPEPAPSASETQGGQP